MEVTLSRVTKWTQAERAAIAAETERYGAFVGLPVQTAGAGAK